MEDNHSGSIILVSAALAITLIAFLTTGSEQKTKNKATPKKTEWSYSGEKGSNNWAKLSPEFYECSGKNQSPINLIGFVESVLKPINFNYKIYGNEILNNGHTIQVNYPKGNSIILDSQSFELKQFHFHAPSENRINGKSYPLELHFVHVNKKGKLAIVAVMFSEGKENTEIIKAWLKMPIKKGDKNILTKVIDPKKLLPTVSNYYRFNGSLTTPPCSEGVRWIVMKKPLTASKKQIKDFTDVIGHPNNRPIQLLNARLVLQ